MLCSVSQSKWAAKPEHQLQSQILAIGSAARSVLSCDAGLGHARSGAGMERKRVCAVAGAVVQDWSSVSPSDVLGVARPLVSAAAKLRRKAGGTQARELVCSNKTLFIGTAAPFDRQDHSLRTPALV